MQSATFSTAAYGATGIALPRSSTTQQSRRFPSVNAQHYATLRSTRSDLASGKALSASLRDNASTLAGPVKPVAGLLPIKKSPRMARKTVIVTGASSGLGLATLKSLMESDQWHVVCGVRDVDKMQEICDKEGYPRDAYSIYHLELKSKDSVHAFVKKFRGSRRTLDVLCCNAAVYLPNQPGPTMGDYGYEESLTVNHLSHFLMVNLMIKDLKQAKEPRCIIVGSITGNTNTVGGGAVHPHADLGNLEGLKSRSVMVDGLDYNGAKAYKDSKLANMMTVLELHRRYHENTGIVFCSMYPGCVAETALFRQKRGWFRSFFPIFMKYVTGGYVSQEEAGNRLAEVITSPKCNKSGVYWSWNGGARSPGWYNPVKGQVIGAGGAGGEIFENTPSQECRNERKAKKLWQLSEQAVGLA
mmetsp:Transcript_40449/g.114539  ORF Transcript_40449/g.114539 Transcript_40449/m.114539 type:complete len:414 (-) Transcript_40449:196-1437(-)|eukprot:CAMPEP_0117675846 /NCGR_PEP_ID=MMETSP0804-20121206/15834_1 /TAXON_ID=1074897 /ORGANISM="Tetraselmis astigmatica, Strain CCMP880" /LENGTH=413 /DNA_ID=CAMNT_0005484899 /DNA_START=142 /DNA_END=1383 /DNA_ORIENTATION=+